MRVLPAIFLIVIEAFAIRYAYMAWFRPKDYFRLVYGLRKGIATAFPFVPKIWTVKAITDRPGLDLWWARLISLFVVLAGTVALLGTLLQALQG